MKHNIHIGFELNKGVIIEGIDCPFEEKLDTIQELMKEQIFININEHGYYSIHPLIPNNKAQNLVHELMRILFDSPIQTCSDIATEVEK